jgi:hypothetical protein
MAEPSSQVAGLTSPALGSPAAKSTSAMQQTGLTRLHSTGMGHHPPESSSPQRLPAPCWSSLAEVPRAFVPGRQYGEACLLLETGCRGASETHHQKPEPDSSASWNHSDRQVSTSLAPAGRGSLHTGTLSTRKPKVGGYAERGATLLAVFDLRVIGLLGLHSRWVPLKAPRAAILAMAGFVGLGRNCYSAAISFEFEPGSQR